jgi:hypothetical protein
LLELCGQVSSLEQQPLVIGDDHIQTEPVRVPSESSDNTISGDITGAADAVNDKTIAAASSETAASARTQEEPPICNAITTATDGAIEGDVALINAAVGSVVQATDVPDSIPDTIIATTEVNDKAAPLFTTAVVSGEALSDDATTAVAPIDGPQAASDDTIIVTTAATEQSVLSTAVPTVATAAAVVAATVTQIVTTITVTPAVTTQGESAAAELPAEVATETSTRTDAITNDVDTTLPSIPDEHASITAVNVEEPVTVSVPSESATAAATPVTATLSTAAAVVTPAVITSAAAPPVVVAAAAVAAAATAASTYVIDGQALTLQHNAENAQAIEALLALVARLQMNTVSTVAAATTETATAVATDTAAPLTIAAVTAIPSSSAAATVTTETQAVPAVVIDHDGGDNASAVHAGDMALSSTADNTAVSEDDTIVLTEANVMAIQEQQLSDETAACVTVEMLPEAPTTAPVAIASTDTTANYIVQQQQQQQQHDDVLSDADAADLADTSALNDAFDDDNDDTELALQQQQHQQQQQAIQAVVVAAIAATEQSSMVHARSTSHTDSTTEEHKESDDAITASTAITDTSKIADVTSNDTTTADIAALVTSMVTAVVLKSDSTSNNDTTSTSNNSTMITAAMHYDGAVAALTPLSPERSVHEQLLVNGTLQSDAVTVRTAQSRRSLATNDLTVVVSGTTVNGQEQRVRRRSSMAEYLSSPTQALQQLRAPSDKQRARNDSECENTADSAVDPYREHLGDDFRKTPWKPPSKSIAREDQRYNLFRRGNAKLWKVTNLDLFVLGEGVGLYFVWLNYLMVFTAIATVLSIPAILIR